MTTMSISNAMNIAISILVLVHCIHVGSAQRQQSQCYTPDRRSGECIDLRQCNVLYNLIKKINLSPAERNYLRLSQCAYYGYPYVCCPYDNQPNVQQPPPVQQPNVNTQTTPKPASGGLRISDLPQPGQCGNHLADRIVGGVETQISEYPWMALIEYTKPTGKGFHCGGVLINKDYVLTASHCVNGKDLAQLRWTLSGVRLGEWDTATNQDCEEDNCSDPVLDIPVSERTPHPDYQIHSRTQENDIALLRLARSVQFTDWIRPICLPTSPNVRNRNYDNFPLVVAGWGKTENASNSNIKLKVEIDGVPLDQCNNVYRIQNVVLTPKQLCAGGVPGKDSCRGDSGGPLMALDNSERLKSYYYLAGVVSFGPSPCGLANWPGVYTRADSYLDWILATMRP